MLLSIREIYKIPQEAKIILYVGNISVNKNQLQMVEAFGLLPKEIQKTTYVLFCGRPDVTINLGQLIENKGYKEHLILCGAINKVNMPDFYRQSDAVVLISHAEGFGLSLIEGMHFGKPCAIPIDLDAFEDIYNPNAVIEIRGRSDECVAKALIKLLSKKWDRDAIIQHSTKFDSSIMAMAYVKVYRQAIEDERTA